MSESKAGFSLHRILTEYSIPLIAGVIVALGIANVAPHGYHEAIDTPLPFLGLSFHFLVNDIFMVLFFGIAAKEITESCLPGGSLNPPSKAINPLFATIGGCVCPILVYLGLVGLSGEWTSYSNGWGIPTATDIALAWLVARLVFGAKHPAVNYLLLLAVADDAIGLGIIAVAYPDPTHPTQPIYLSLVGVAMAASLVMRKMKIMNWQAYILGPGVLSWIGLHSAHLHPALALCFVVPFLPSASTDDGLYVHESDEEYLKTHKKNPLHDFEHSLKGFVDYGLFFFAFANAGVEVAEIGMLTWIILSSLIVGKTVGVAAFAMFAQKIGFPMPQGMGLRHVLIAGLIAGIGLTVALFVSGEAFPGAGQGEAKMGALLSGLVAFAALLIGRLAKASDLEGPPLVPSDGTPPQPLNEVVELIAETESVASKKLQEKEEQTDEELSEDEVT